MLTSAYLFFDTDMKSMDNKGYLFVSSNIKLYTLFLVTIRQDLKAGYAHI